jgi:branched-subunit amino acid transport protein
MALLILLAAGVVTWLMRASFIIVGSGAELPAVAERLIAHTRPAILAALVTSAVLAQGGGDAQHVPLAWLIATVVTAIAARWRGNLGLSGAAGLATLWLATAVGA